MIDLDGLKQVNDQGGHGAGDTYLKNVTQTIGRQLRLTDIFARIGGDEFAVLLPHTSAEQAQKMAQTLSEMVKGHTPGSVSIGIAMIASGQTKDALQRADGAMYQAKQQGRGRVAGPL